MSGYGWPAQVSGLAAMGRVLPGAVPRAALPVRAGGGNQDRADDLGRGVVVVTVEHREVRTRRRGGLSGEWALEPAGAVLARRIRTAR